MKSQFFEIVWKINAIVILAAGLLSLAVLSVVGFKFYRDFTRDRQASSLVTVAPESEDESEKLWKFGYQRSLAGHDTVVFPLNSEESIAQSHYSKVGNSLRNLLFFNPVTNRSQWLLESNNSLIVDDLFIEDSKFKKISVGLYVVVKSDTNKDGILSARDNKVISVSKADGSEYREIQTNIDQYLGASIVEEKFLSVFYLKEKIGYSTKVQLSDFSVVSTASFPQIRH